MNRDIMRFTRPKNIIAPILPQSTQDKLHST